MAKKTTVKNRINQAKGIVTVLTTVEETDVNGDLVITETEEEFSLEEWEKMRKSSSVGGTPSKSTNHSSHETPIKSSHPDSISKSSSQETPRRVHFNDSSSSIPSPPPQKTPPPSSPSSRSPSRSPTRSPSQSSNSSTSLGGRSPRPESSSTQEYIERRNTHMGSSSDREPVYESVKLSSQQARPLPTVPTTSLPDTRSSPFSSPQQKSPRTLHDISEVKKRNISTQKWDYARIEFDILFYINLIRQHPQKFLPLLYERQRFYRDGIYRIPGKTPIQTTEGERAVIEAIEFLKKQRPISPLYYSFGMSQAARDHVVDLGEKGLTGTSSSLNPQRTYKDRMDAYGYITGVSFAENISYGVDKAQTIVLDMLIDDGDTNRSHRKYLFSDDWKYVGIGYGPHSKLRWMCVIDFCDGYTDTETNIALAKKPTTSLNEDHLVFEDMQDVCYEGVPSDRIKQVYTRGPTPKSGATLFNSGQKMGIALYSPYSSDMCVDGSVVDFVFTLEKDVDLTKLFLINNDMWYEAKQYFIQGVPIYHGRLTKLQRGKVGILYENSYLLRFEVS